MSAKDDKDVEPLDIVVTVLRDPNWIVLKPYKDTLFLFKSLNMITYEMHVAIIKGPARKRGRESAVEAVRWLWLNTDAQKIVSWIPEYNVSALMYAKVCGMVKEGTLKDAYLKDGQLHNLEVIGMTKNEYIERYGLCRG